MPSDPVSSGITIAARNGVPDAIKISCGVVAVAVTVVILALFVYNKHEKDMVVHTARKKKKKNKEKEFLPTSTFDNELECAEKGAESSSPSLIEIAMSRSREERNLRLSTSSNGTASYIGNNDITRIPTSSSLENIGVVWKLLATSAQGNPEDSLAIAMDIVVAVNSKQLMDTIEFKQKVTSKPRTMLKNYRNSRRPSIQSIV